MTGLPAVAGALEAAGLPTDIRSQRELSGGCIHRVVEVELPDDRRVVAKINRDSALGIFREEAVGLHTLYNAGAVMVPAPLAIGVFAGDAVLLLTAIERGPAGPEAWRRLGEDLAALHLISAGDLYGFEIDNHIGSTAQPNGWADDWVAFNAEHRLGFQLRLARDRGLVTGDEAKRVEATIDHLDRLIPRRPARSLLHGDLWSGNALPTTDEDGAPRVAIIDPACSIGDGWADVAMMRLFGGFPRECYAAYEEAVGEAENVEERIGVYQLYHLLNHVNIFGRGYVGQAIGVVGTLGF